MPNHGLERVFCWSCWSDFFLLYCDCHLVKVRGHFRSGRVASMIFFCETFVCSAFIKTCFSDGPSAAAPAVWSRLLHDEHGLHPELPQPPPPGASPPPPRLPASSPAPQTTAPPTPWALAPAATGGQCPVNSRPKNSSVQFLNEHLPPSLPLCPQLGRKSTKKKVTTGQMLNKKQLSLNLPQKL